MITGRNRRLLALLGAVLLASMMSVFALASPAAASPYWQTYTFTNKWSCEPRTNSVYWESCIVVNGNYTQAVLIVDNQTGAPQTIGATVNLWQAGNLRSTVYCYSSTLNTGLTRACFGPTFKAACGVAVQGDNTLYLDWNTVRALSRTELMCSS